MQLTPTNTNGRRFACDTRFGAGSITLDRSYTGPLFDAAGNRVGEADFEIKSPPPTDPAVAATLDQQAKGGGRAGCCG